LAAEATECFQIFHHLLI